MPQYGYTEGVDLQPEVVDYLLKKRESNYQPPQFNRAKAVLDELTQIRQRQASPEYQGMLTASQQGDPMMAMMPAIAKAASQFGTLRGQSADTSAVGEMANAVEKRRQQQILLGEKSQNARDAFDEVRLKQAAVLDESDRDYYKAIASDVEKANKLAYEKTKDKQDQYWKQKEFDQKQEEIAAKKAENEGLYATTVEGRDDLGNPITRVLNKKGGVINTYAGKPPAVDKSAEKSKQESDYRYISLKNRAQKLKDLVDQYGTVAWTGTGGAEMDSAIYQMAVDFAKLVDPDSVAREGEVAAAQKYMLPIRNTTMGIPEYKNSTAKSLIDKYITDLDERLAARTAAREGNVNAVVYKKKQEPDSGVAYAAGVDEQPAPPASGKRWKRGDVYNHPDGGVFIFNGTDFEER